MNDFDTDFVFFEQKKLEKDIGSLTKNQVKPFWSMGKWSMHDLLLYLLHITGPANVYLSTFSISEAAIRALSQAMDEGKIKTIRCIFDYTVKTHKLHLLYFAGNVVSEIALTPNHSKLILIENDQWKISVVGSANMTPNPRKEAGVILTIPEIFDQYLHFFIQTFKNANTVNYHD